MEVRPVSGNQPAYKGYVHKSVNKFVNELVKSECKPIIEQANKNRELVNTDELVTVYKQGKRIIDKFTQFIGPTHKKTNIHINRYLLSIRYSDNPKIAINNSDYFFQKKDCWGVDKDVIFLSEKKGCVRELNNKNKKPSDKLNILEQVADDLLSSVKPAEIDNAILKNAENDLQYNAYENGTGFFGKILTRLEAKTIDKYAKEVGLETPAKEDAERYIQMTKNAKKIEKENLKKQKLIEKQNTQALKNIPEI